MKLLIILFILLFPIKVLGKSAFRPMMLPTICLPVEIFVAGNREVGEQILMYGPAHDGSILFQLYLNKDKNNPTFSAVLQKENEICVLAVGKDLEPHPPNWWFEEQGLGCE
jgi:hypothetical protein|tara:strand:- start:68 stop:400 length:333 start_codon:yes stop_codon:yes gene_type:complete